ncbi:MAG: hypothetical protein AAF456_23705 [Planctomycetota bacterium]
MKKIIAILVVVFLMPVQSSCAREPQVQQRNEQQAGGDSTNDGAAVESDQPLVQLGTIRDNRISESSGLARSFTAEGAYWTHNDSGNAPVVFLLAPDGRLLAEVNIEGVENRDWEAMTSVSLNGAGFLMIGEVGDNSKRYRSYRLLMISEPAVSDEVRSAIREDVEGFQPTVFAGGAMQFEFTYKDGRHNCEAIAYDESAGKVWLVEKVYVDDQRETPPGIYCIDFGLSEEEFGRAARGVVALPQARRIADFPVRNVTGMSISPDGRRMLIRTYLAGFLYSREESESWAEVLQNQRPQNIALPIQRQGEAVCFSCDSDSIVVTSENTRQAIWQINLAAQLNSGRNTDTTEEEAAVSGNDG